MRSENQSPVVAFLFFVERLPIPLDCDCPLTNSTG